MYSNLKLFFRIIASASFDKSIKLWDSMSGKFITSLRGHVQAVYVIAWSSDSRLMVSGSADSTLKGSHILQNACEFFLYIILIVVICSLEYEDEKARNRSSWTCRCRICSGLVSRWCLCSIRRKRQSFEIVRLFIHIFYNQYLI